MATDELEFDVRADEIRVGDKIVAFQASVRGQLCWHVGHGLNEELRKAVSTAIFWRANSVSSTELAKTINEALAGG